MTPEKIPLPADPEHEIAGLIATLRETERRLEELTGGEVDTVAGESGRPFLLRRAQEELRFSEADTQSAILNSLPAHIALLDAQGVIVSTNEAWRHLAQASFLQGPQFGIGVSYLRGCDEAGGAEDPVAQQAAAGVRSVLGGATTFSIEYPCPAPAGQRWFLMTVTPLIHSGGRGAVVMHLNITARKLADGALRESQGAMAAAQHIGHFGSWEVDLNAENDEDANTLRWSDEMFRIAGYEPGAVAVTNQFFFSRIPPGDRAPIRQTVAAAIRERKPYSLVHRFIRANGEICILQETAKIFYDENTGQPVKIIGTAHDITERKRAQDALRASEQRFKALFDQAAVGVVQSDAATGQFVEANQRFCEIVGYSARELKQLTVSEVTHPQDLRRTLEMLGRVKAGVIREYSQEKRYVRKDRSEVWTHVTVSAMWPPGETPDYFLVIVQDITERKRLDEHFLQAQKMEAFGQFSGGVAHDFNNILATISGYTELSRMILKDNPDVHHHLGAVLLAAGRAADLVKQILTFSRQQPQLRQTIQLRAVVEESIKLLRATIPSTIAFDPNVAADAPTVLANANQIHQVLMNLGVNAWHAMKERPGRLKIVLEKWQVDDAQAAAQPRLRPGSYARVSVSDTGCGMEAATLRRIFEPFFTTKPVGEGTGLGLSVVHGIMDGHDGAITVESQPGEGTVFHLYFPAHTGEAAAAVIDGGPIPRGNGEAVLIVDDEDLIASMMQQTLNQLGYAAEFSTDPLAALALVQSDSHRFQLVLSDQTMPGMTGLALATRLRELRPELPVILMTGFSASLTPARIEKAGVRDVLLKPLTVHQLASALHSVLSPRVPN